MRDTPMNSSGVSNVTALERSDDSFTYSVTTGRQAAPLCSGKNLGLGVIGGVIIVVIIIVARISTGGHGDDPSNVDPPIVDNRIPAYLTIPGIGSIKGFQDGPLAIFRGLPFARPPIGDLRWRAPEPHNNWQGTRMAQEYGSSCMGAGDGNASESEDCLFLNIVTPMKAVNHSEKLAVMLWIHGGIGGCSYESGSGRLFPSDAKLVNASNRSVVVVSFNYRLNVFGFLGADELMRRSLSTSAGNFGLEDQTRAMAWVRSYIAVFGGDPKRIVLFGEGAGGNSIYHHLVMAMSNRLYARVIIQSGASPNQTIPLHEAQTSFKKIAEKANCPTLGNSALDCLLKKDAKDLLMSIPRPFPHPMRWGPVIDGVVLKDRPSTLIEAGNFSRFGPAGEEIQLMIGSNTDEFAYFLSLLGPDYKMKEDTFDKMTASLGFDFTPAELKQVKDIYTPGGNYSYPSNLGTFSKWWWMLQRVASDGVVRVSSFPTEDEDVGNFGRSVGLGHCTAKWAAVDMSAYGANVYSYLFDQPRPNTVRKPPRTMLPGTSVPHGSEIDFVFDNVDGHNVSHAMASYWSNFATSGNPNELDLPAWFKYTQAGDDTLVLRDASPGDASSGIHDEKGIRKEACSFWRKFSNSCKFCGPSSQARGVIAERMTAVVV